jgi:hypothetical protein
VARARAVRCIVGVSLIVLLAGCALSPGLTKPVVPEALAVPPGQVLSVEARATGVQIYQCDVNKDDPARVEWVFKAPSADLFDTAGKPIGKHYGGPTWEAADGSKVVGEVQARNDGPDPQAIPWLLLRAKPSAGDGIFARTQSIQRVQTSGGRAPAQGCTDAVVGTQVRVPYTATYYFYR